MSGASGAGGDSATAGLDGKGLDRALSSEDPTDGLRAVGALRALADQLESLHVGRARELGWSWQDIALVLGVTKQAVHKKHGADRLSAGRPDSRAVRRRVK